MAGYTYTEIYSENILHLLIDVFLRLVNIKDSSWSFVISISNTTCIFASLYSPLGKNKAKANDHLQVKIFNISILLVI